MFALALVAAHLFTATPSDQVKALLTAQAEAWNRGDLDAFCAVYAPDALFISPSGTTRGKDQVLARYKKRYPDKKAMGTLSFEFIETRESPAFVSIAAKWKLSYPGKPAAEGHTLLVLRKRGDGWEILQDASM